MEQNKADRADAVINKIIDFCRENGIELYLCGCSCCGEIRIVENGEVLKHERYVSFEVDTEHKQGK